jgi:hypothetical protein
MNNLKQRLAKANGMNSMLCFRAKDEINRLETKLHRIEDLLMLIWEADPEFLELQFQDQPEVLKTLDIQISKIGGRQLKRKRWNFEDN